MSQKSGYEDMFHYMHLITGPFESRIPILAIKPSHSRSGNISLFKMQLGHNKQSFLVWTCIDCQSIKEAKRKFENSRT